MLGALTCPTAITLLAGLKATLKPVPAGNVAGLGYLDPKPVLALIEYAVTKGVVVCAKATEVIPPATPVWYK